MQENVYPANKIDLNQVIQSTNIKRILSDDVQTIWTNIHVQSEPIKVFKLTSHTFRKKNFPR